MNIGRKEMNKMIDRIKENQFFIMLTVVTLMSAALVMSLMAVMVDNMTRIF